MSGRAGKGRGSGDSDGGDDDDRARDDAPGARERPGLAERIVGRVLGDGIQQDLTGGRHGLSYLANLARGNKIRRRAVFDAIREDRPPVLLIHGFLGTRGSMFALERRLNADGICVFSFNLGMLNTRDIRTSAFLIHRKIEAILAQTKVKHINIVGHSMGGLIGLYYVKKLGGWEKVRRLVLMGTPVTGTWAALAGVATLGIWSASSWQLLPSSEFMAELSSGPLPPQVDFYTIGAERDWLCPINSCWLDGATNMTVPLGHSSLVVAQEVYDRIRWALMQEVRRPDGDGDAEGGGAGGDKGGGPGPPKGR